ncbi:MAG: non-heme iron oxygenase ferredoxin subunit [Actinomycetota bacterium]
MSALVDVAPLEELPPGGTLRVEVEGTPVCLVNVDGVVHAVHDVCTHALESLSGGWVEEDRIECPRHGATFSVVTGEALSPPASLPLPTFRTVVEGDRILVDPTPSHPHPIA